MLNDAQNNDILEYNETFLQTKQKSDLVWQKINKAPDKFKVLTGDRPTSSLHIGHYFGTLQNRVKLQNMGVTTFIVIPDYQVLYDRETSDTLRENVYNLILDYLSSGLDPDNYPTYIFAHSHVPELNQLMLPFLTLITMPELDRNPTVKDDIRNAANRNLSALTYTYPVHQAADILFCNPNIIPVGKDQLPHIELTRKIARRFNERFSKKVHIFTIPDAILSHAPVILGLDGVEKMSKSKGNSVMIKSTADETAKLIKGAKTDMIRSITYDPTDRPEVANLLLIASLCLNKSPEIIANEIADDGAGKLKQIVTDALNDYFAPIRKKRLELEKNDDYVKATLIKGIEKAREEAQITLQKVLSVMNMKYY